MCVVQYDPTENTNIFKEFYSGLAESLVNKLPDAPNKYNKSTTENIKKANNDVEFQMCLQTPLKRYCHAWTQQKLQE